MVDLVDAESEHRDLQLSLRRRLHLFEGMPGGGYLHQQVGRGLKPRRNVERKHLVDPVVAEPELDPQLNELKPVSHPHNRNAGGRW